VSTVQDDPEQRGSRSLVHLPAGTVVSEKLRRVQARTRPAKTWRAEPGGVLLGVNTHRGKETPAGIGADLRPRHCYIAGASGTGKSTLLLNMIKQDIDAGCGVGVLDPHGDLAEEVAALVPAKRSRDLIYFDPADEDNVPA
jgi:hypothetical protein